MRFTVRRMMVVVAGIAGALWLYESCYVCVGDGCYDLAVHVRSGSEIPIRAVTCEAFVNESSAAYSLGQLLPPEGIMWVASADPFTGQVLSVLVPFTVRISPSGRLVGDYQFRSLLVIVTYGDGRRIGKLVPLPHRDVTKSVSVEFP